MLLANSLPVEEVLTTPKSTISGLWRECTKLFERVYEDDADDQRIQHGLDDTLVQHMLRRLSAFTSSALGLLPQKREAFSEHLC